MKFVLAGGGTGGHAYPAIAVGERLREQPETELVFYGTAKGPEREIAASAGIPFREMPASQLRGRSPVRVSRGTWNLLRGMRVASRLLEEDRPNAVFATGGYASAPLGRASQQRRVPLVVFLPDVVPGWAVRFLARQATRVACAVEGSLAHLPADKAVVTGYPVRNQFVIATCEEGRERFGLDPNLKTVLVAGGSQGSHQINLEVHRALRPLLERAQLVHVAGPLEEPWLRKERDRLPDWLKERYHLLAYTEEMAWAMAAADLAVVRAGASSMGELPVVGLPAIVIPGGFSDQQANAAFLAERGGAISLSTTEVDRLGDMVLELLEQDEQRARMAEAMRALAKPDAAERIAALVREVAA